MATSGDDKDKEHEAEEERRRELIVRRLKEATRRRTPVWTPRVKVAAAISVSIALLASAYSAFRIAMSERDYQALQRSSIRRIGIQLIGGVQLQVQVAVTFAKAASVMVQFDGGSSMVRPLSRDIDAMLESAMYVRERSTREATGPTNAQQVMELLSAKLRVSDMGWAIAVNFPLVEFSSMAASLISAYHGVTNLQIAPHGVISAIFPMRGSEDSIGHDLFLDEDLSSAIIRSASLHKALFTGPARLEQRGIWAFTIWNPTFVNGTFWGFTSAVCELNEFFEATPLAKWGGSDVSYVLYSIGTNRKRLLSASNDVPGQSLDDSEGGAWYSYSLERDPESVEIFMDELSLHWELLLWPKSGWQAHSDNLPIHVFLCLIMPIVGLLSMYSGFVRQSVIGQVTLVLADLCALEPLALKVPFSGLFRKRSRVNPYLETDDDAG